ncbi:hypothetical protein L596_019327 [Steinernema carpocapsae]|uniref:Uncharacterized protein n=1 Tax=Steinernema carpocapsae TaxID=34508 RepID=A0A4V6A0J2_STECR|nr:hypothetical protein L596_019327 [Steinernema carpocapsae]
MKTSKPKMLQEASPSLLFPQFERGRLKPTHTRCQAAPPRKPHWKVLRRSLSSSQSGSPKCSSYILHVTTYRLSQRSREELLPKEQTAERSDKVSDVWSVDMLTVSVIQH